MSTADVARPSYHYGHSKGIRDEYNGGAGGGSGKNTSTRRPAEAAESRGRHHHVGAFPGIVEDVVALLSPEYRPILLCGTGTGTAKSSTAMLESVLDSLLSCCTEGGGRPLPKNPAKKHASFPRANRTTTTTTTTTNPDIIKRCVDAGAVEFTLDLLVTLSAAGTANMNTIASTNAKNDKGVAGVGIVGINGIGSGSGSGSGLGISDNIGALLEGAIVMKDTVTWESKALRLLDTLLLTEERERERDPADPDPEEESEEEKPEPSSACSRALSTHPPAVVANAVAKRLLRVSPSTTLSALSVLVSLFRSSPSFRACVSSSAATSIPAKLVLILQVGADSSSKRNATRLLRWIARETKTNRPISSEKTI